MTIVYVFLFCAILSVDYEQHPYLFASGVAIFTAVYVIDRWLTITPVH